MRKKVPVRVLVVIGTSTLAAAALVSAYVRFQQPTFDRGIYRTPQQALGAAIGPDPGAGETGSADPIIVRRAEIEAMAHAKLGPPRAGMSQDRLLAARQQVADAHKMVEEARRSFAAYQAATQNPSPADHTSPAARTQ